MATGRELRQLKLDPLPLIHSVTFSPDGRLVAAAAQNGTVGFWEAGTGKAVQHFLGGGRAMEMLVGFSPDSRKLVAAASDGTIVRWDSATRKWLRSFAPRPGYLTSLVLAGDKVLAAGPNGLRMFVWDVLTGQELVQTPGHSTAVTDLSFAADGKTLASLSRADGRTCVWDLATGKELRRLETYKEPLVGPARTPTGVQRPALAPNGRYVAASTVSSRSINLWALGTGKSVPDIRVPGMTLSPWPLALSGDGELLAFLTGDQRVHLWSVPAAKEVVTPPNQPSGQLIELILAANGKSLAGISQRFEQQWIYELQAWDTGTGKQFPRVSGFAPSPYEGVSNLVLSADGRTLAARGQDGAIHLLDVATGRDFRRLQWSEGTTYISCVFSPDGKSLAAVWCRPEPFTPAQRGQVCLWEIASGSIRLEINDHQGLVQSLAFSPDSRTLATGGSDGTVLLWDLAAPLPALPPRVGEGTGGGPAALAARDLQQTWSVLADADARRAYQAMLKLVAAPQSALPFLQRQLQPVPPQRIEPSMIQQWIAQLDHDNFWKREEASRELEHAGKAARPALFKAREHTRSLEVRRRVEQVLEKIDRPDPAPDMVRPLRVLEVLERIGTREARQILAALAGGKPDAELTLEARAALDRLEKQSRD